MLFTVRGISVAESGLPWWACFPLHVREKWCEFPRPRAYSDYISCTYNYYSPHATACTAWNEGKISDCVRSHASIALNLNCEREMKWLFSAAGGGKFSDLSPRCDALPAWRSFYERWVCLGREGEVTDVCNNWGAAVIFPVPLGLDFCPAVPSARQRPQEVAFVSASSNSRVIFHLDFQVVRSENTLPAHAYFKHLWEIIIRRGEGVGFVLA